MRTIEAAPDERLLSLDAFRGITMALTIIVSTPGYDKSYPIITHAAWHGCSLADLAFPFFLFIIGIAISISLSRRAARGDSHRDVMRQVFRRSLVLIGMGLMSSALAASDLSSLRFSGVLQRIAACYFACSFLFLKTEATAQAILGAVIVFGYWIFMTWTPVPGYGAGNFTPMGNLASFIDRWVMDGHIYRHAYDPEGILSTLPAIATTILGLLTSYWLGSRRTPMEKVRGMLVAGAAGVAGGLIWNIWFPINKRIWTSSYVLFTGGLALWLLALCYWLIEVRGYRRWAKPFEMFGVNSIAAYIIPIMIFDVTNLWRMPRMDGSPGNLRFWLCDHIFGTWMSPLNASMAYAVGGMFVWLGFFWVLYRKKIFIKI